jgi:hypothetical protein
VLRVEIRTLRVAMGFERAGPAVGCGGEEVDSLTSRDVGTVLE